VNPQQPSIAYASLRCRCPRCGKGKLYHGLLTVNETCAECGLPLKLYGQGDGPASLSILIIGALAGIGASVLDVKVQPPLWVHAVIWIPFVILGSLLSLRSVKAAMIAAQYQYRKDDFGN
jgi:uncharacterized protein (DUF983 family)